MTQQYPLTYHYPKVEKPSEQVCKPLRHIVVAVMLKEKRTLHINQIRAKVKQRLGEKDENDDYLYPTSLRKSGHNTVERRINECADPRHWDGVAPLVHVGDPKSPFYGLNFDKFAELKKQT